MSSLPLIAYDPVSAAFGEDSSIARLNKSAVDPGGLLFKSEHILGKEFESKVDFMGWGGKKRYEQEQQTKDIEESARLQQQGQTDALIAQDEAAFQQKRRNRTPFTDPDEENQRVGYGYSGNTIKV
jgi:hypothetical protein